MGFLEDVSLELYEEAHRHVDLALRDSDHPWIWTKIVRAQAEKLPHLLQGHPEDYRMPAPMLGWVPDPVVLVVGQNPNVAKPQCLYPRLDAGRWTREAFPGFYADYFRFRKQGKPGDRLLGNDDDGVKVVVLQHFVKVERYLADALGDQALGRVAQYVDAIPWASTGLGGSLLDAGVATAARQRICRFVHELKPGALIGLGWAPTDLLTGRKGSPNPTTFAGIPYLRVKAPNARGLTREGVLEEAASVREFLSRHDLT